MKHLSIKVDTNNLNYSSVDGILFNKTQTELIQFPTSRTGSYIIPSSVTSIGSYAFMYCNGLTNVLISPSVTSIGVGAFCHCLGLTSIVVPLSVTSIGIYAFADCSRLVSVTIPSSIISIESWAFSGCTGLRSIYIYKKPPPSLDNSIDVFSLVNETTCTLYVPYGSKTQYATANQWKDFWNIIEMPGIFLSNYSIGMDSDAGTAQISISSSSNWTATSNQTWLAVTPSVGTGTNSLTFTAQENPNKTARSSTVTVSAAGVESQTITVIQEAKSTTGIDQLSKKSEFIVYPNPTTGKIKLVFDEIPLSGISVIINDIVGKNCLKQLIREKESWIDLSGNVRGIYFIKTDQENFKTQKVILK